jgi:Nucleotidyltransferase/DNA polymerase involved in DNA repair
MERVILHCDLNNFFASVECRGNDELKGKPVAVCGNEAVRHGIVLAKNELAKKYGIKTAMPVWEARRLCPELVCLAPHMDEYIKMSKRVRAIYEQYTDQVESFGIDECWLDVTGSQKLFGSGYEMAHSIRKEIKEKLDLTVSVGVSFNKIFAKLGSDYKKPDAVTVFSRDNYKNNVWALPVEDLLFVGRASAKTLRDIGIDTIGDLASAPRDILESKLGKMGGVFWNYANGYDAGRVMRTDESIPAKSIGNSTTTPRDLETDYDVKMVLYSLSDTVATRMREQNLRCQTVEIWVRDSRMSSFVRRHKLDFPTCITNNIAREAYSLFLQSYDWQYTIRGIGVRVSCLTPMDADYQTDMFCDHDDVATRERLAMSVDGLRKRYGYKTVLTGIAMADSSVPVLSPRECREAGASMYDLTPQR